MALPRGGHGDGGEPDAESEKRNGADERQHGERLTQGAAVDEDAGSGEDGRGAGGEGHQD